MRSASIDRCESPFVAEMRQVCQAAAAFHTLAALIDRHKSAAVFAGLRQAYRASVRSIHTRVYYIFHLNISLSSSQSLFAVAIHATLATTVNIGIPASPAMDAARMAAPVRWPFGMVGRVSHACARLGLRSHSARSLWRMPAIRRVATTAALVS